MEQIYTAQPDDGPMALEIVDALVRSGAFGLALGAVMLPGIGAEFVPISGIPSLAAGR